MKMDGRLLGLSLVFFIFFTILESSAQNFYPLRYGKRDNRAEGRLLRGTRYDRSSEQTGNMFYSSMYGKRPPNEVPSDDVTGSRNAYANGEYLPKDSVEYASAEMSDRYERSPDTRNKFYVGPRFGKRDGHHHGRKEEEHILCRHTGIRDLYHCLEEVF